MVQYCVSKYSIRTGVLLTEWAKPVTLRIKILWFDFDTRISMEPRTSGVAASTVIQNAVLCFVVAGLTAKSSLLAFIKAYRILVSLKVSEDCVVIVVLVAASAIVILRHSLIDSLPNCY